MIRKNGTRSAIFMILAPLVLTACMSIRNEGSEDHLTGWGIRFIHNAVFIGHYMNGITESELANMRLEHDEEGCNREDYGENSGPEDSKFWGWRCTLTTFGIESK